MISQILHAVPLFIGVAVAALVVLIVVLKSVYSIGPRQIGLVTKRIGARLPDDNPIALQGEAGYQADLLTPGLRWKFWPVYTVSKFQWVQIPAGQIGVVVAQVGAKLPIGAKSARYKPEFGTFGDLRTFLTCGGEKGVQRPVLPPGTVVPIHPVGFLVLTKSCVYGRPVSAELEWQQRKGELTCKSFGIEPQQLNLARIEPQATGAGGEVVDTVGIVTTFEGEPLPSGLIASRLGGFDDVEKMEISGAPDADIVDALTGSQNTAHNNYQDFQKFLDAGGKIGLQHDPLLYGAYALNPFLVRVDVVPMLVVRQGEVAVIKAYVGLSTEDTSGATFKFGSLVRPGHRGIWQEPLRTGKYPINPRCYQAEIVPTSILTLNWADAVSEAHDLDRQLSQIVAKSCEGFVFKIDLQVQIHVPDTKAPRVISTVGTMKNLVNEVLQAAVGNHFRDRLQAMPAISFIQTRAKVQVDAQEHITEQLSKYEVETRGVYIQDVLLPEDLVRVLTQREIAHQQIETFAKQKEAQEQRIEMEQQTGVADKQKELASARVSVEIKQKNAEARKAEADGEAAYISQTGAAKGAEIEAIGMARAKGYEAQKQAVGAVGTALVNVITALAEGQHRFVPEIMVGGGDALSGLAATWMRKLLPTQEQESKA